MTFFEWRKEHGRAGLEALAEALQMSADSLNLVALGHKNLSYDRACDLRKLWPDVELDSLCAAKKARARRVAA